MNVEEPQEPEIPVTILTGFLGAGKTTLLNRILKENHNHKIAIIENEFGTENVDNDLLVTENNEQIVHEQWLRLLYYPRRSFAHLDQTAVAA